MSRDETALELEKLRADVAALKEARQAAEQEPEPPPETAGPAESAGRAEPSEATEAITKKEQNQLEELSALLEAEIRDHPTVTTLAVSAPGERLMRAILSPNG